MRTVVMVGYLALVAVSSVSCVSDGTLQSVHADSAGVVSEVGPVPDAKRIEQAHNEDDFVWITSRFSGSDGTLNYRDAIADYWIWQYVGYAFLRTADYPRATVALRRVLQLKPNFSPAIYNLACIATLSRQSDQAIELLQLLASRVRPYESLKRKYHGMLLTDPDLLLLQEHADFSRTLALFR